MSAESIRRQSPRPFTKSVGADCGDFWRMVKGGFWATAPAFWVEVVMGKNGNAFAIQCRFSLPD
jgi:hypothetical protein